MKVPFTVVKDRAALLDILQSFRPDIVIAGLSFPRVLENVLDEEAVLANIPMVHIEDYWGCHVRSPRQADLYVTIDEAAKRLIENKYPGVPVVIAGFTGIAPSRAGTELVRKMEELRRQKGAKVLVFPDGGPESEEALPMLVESILQTRMPLVLAPKPHPKSYFLPHPQGGSWGEWFEREIAPLREKGMVADFTESTDDVADCADGVASVYGHIIMRPAIAGKFALTLWTPAVRNMLKEETGLEATPLMLHHFPVLERVQPLDGFLRGPHPRLDLKPYDARIAADAALSLLD